jgi:tetratricopeptide (TPR) repeat protein
MAAEMTDLEKALAVGDLGKAAELADAAVGAARGETEKAMALKTLAEIYLAQGQTSDALKAAQDGVSKAGSDKKAEVALMLTVVDVKLAMDASGDAMKTANDALEKAKGAGDKAGQVGAMSRLAQMYLSMDNTSKAIEMATEALTMATDDDKTGTATAHFVLGSATLAADPESMDGIKSMKAALAIFETLGDIGAMSSALHTLANCFFSKGALEEGLNCAREALACYRQMGDTMNEEALKATIEEARAATMELRKTTPKRPIALPTGGASPPSAGPESSTITESTVPKEMMDWAAAGRKYWGVPKHVGPDPTVDAAERAPSHVIVWGGSLSDNVPTQNCIEFGDLVGCMAKGDVAKIPIMVQTCGVNSRMTGQHLPSSFTNMAAVTLWGLVRTVRQEIPQVQIVLLDFNEELTAAQIPRQIRPPIPYVNESAYYHHARYEPQLAQVPSLFRRELKRDNLTGGGGGSQMGDPKKVAKFMRRSFNWTGPTHKLDYCWYRQEWRACGPAEGDVGPMPPPPPCRALRNL